MTESNGDGILKIDRKGMQKVQLGDDGVPFEIDVTRTLDEWYQVDRSFRDEAGKVPAEKSSEYSQAVIDFVRAIFRCGEQDHQGRPELADSVNETEALEFLNRLGAKGAKLRGFFERDSASVPSSPAPSEVRFGG